MATTTGVRIDPDALLDARRKLLRHELSLVSQLESELVVPADAAPCGPGGHR